MLERESGATRERVDEYSAKLPISPKPGSYWASTPPTTAAPPKPSPISAPPCGCYPAILLLARTRFRTGKGRAAPRSAEAAAHAVRTAATPEEERMSQPTRLPALIRCQATLAPISATIVHSHANPRRRLRHQQTSRRPGLDRNPASRADVLADLDRHPYPFRDSSFDALYESTSSSTSRTSFAPWRNFIAWYAPGGEVHIGHPALHRFQLVLRSTHRWHLNSFSLRYFGEDNAGYGYYSQARFQENSVHVKLLALWRWLGFELLVNNSRRFRRFWEHYLCYVVRGKVSSGS